MGYNNKRKYIKFNAQLGGGLMGKKPNKVYLLL